MKPVFLWSELLAFLGFSVLWDARGIVHVWDFGVCPEWRSLKEIKEKGLPWPIVGLTTTTIGKETKLCVTVPSAQRGQ